MQSAFDTSPCRFQNASSAEIGFRLVKKARLFFRRFQYVERIIQTIPAFGIRTVHEYFRGDEPEQKCEQWSHLRGPTMHFLVGCRNFLETKIGRASCRERV